MIREIRDKLALNQFGKVMAFHELKVAERTLAQRVINSSETMLLKPDATKGKGRDQETLL